MGAAFFIHGFATNRNDFARLVPLLSARYDYLLAPDLPGHDPKNRTSMNCGKVIDFVTTTFDDLKEKYGKVDLFGFSMGGALAAYLASVREANRLVLLAPANKFLAPASPFIRAGHDMLKRNPQYNINHTSICTDEEIKRDSKTTREVFLKQLLPYYTPRNMLEFNKLIRYCNSKLQPINAPVLILWGMFDQLVPYSAIRHLLKFCRHNQTRTISYSDISHLMLYSCAYQKIIDDIILFLEKTDAPKLTD